MKSIWKTVIIVALVMVALGFVSITVALITGADYGRVQDLFNATYNVASFKDYFIRIFHIFLGISPFA